ncbi:MAG TPA: ABC transporter permease [Xanthomonadaceae bacterium]|nr:ABC transporter permease [Xanthomonadaceae bacterium]
MSLSVEVAGPRRESSNPFLADLLGSLRHPEFWAYSSWLDIITKYRRTRLGLVWLVLPTAMYLVVLGNVYSHLMNYPLEKYLPYLALGYVSWRFMIQCINDSTNVFRSHKGFIMDGRLQLTDFTLRAVCRPLVYLGFAFLVVIAVLAWSPSVHWANLLSLFVTLPVLILNVIWISFCISLVGARFPDIGEVIHTVLVVGFLLTPILWHIEKFPPGTLRGLLARLNPAFHLIEFVRAPVLGHMPERTTLAAMALLTLGGWLLAMFLYRRYARFVPLWI